MNSTQATSEPKLEKPGAGLPPIEWAIAKYILLPRLFKTTNKEAAIESFSKQSEKILKLSRGMDPALLTARRLVPKSRGLEDSSRYWSVAMTLQHVIIVGDLMREAVVQLSNGNANLHHVGTADVKPETGVDPETIFDEFNRMSNRFIQESTAANVEAFPKLTHPHPWFGPLNAHQWLCFGGIHENIHRKQIQDIIARI